MANSPLTAYVLVNRRNGPDVYVSNIEYGNGCWSETADLRQAQLFDIVGTGRALTMINAECFEYPRYRFVIQTVTIALT